MIKLRKFKLRNLVSIILNTIKSNQIKMPANDNSDNLDHLSTALEKINENLQIEDDQCYENETGEDDFVLGGQIFDKDDTNSKFIKIIIKFAEISNEYKSESQHEKENILLINQILENLLILINKLFPCQINTEVNNVSNSEIIPTLKSNEIILNNYTDIDQRSFKSEKFNKNELLCPKIKLTHQSDLDKQIQFDLQTSLTNFSKTQSIKDSNSSIKSMSISETQSMNESDSIISSTSSEPSNNTEIFISPNIFINRTLITIKINRLCYMEEDMKKIITKGYENKRIILIKAIMKSEVKNLYESSLYNNLIPFFKQWCASMKHNQIQFGGIISDDFNIIGIIKNLSKKEFYFNNNFKFMTLSIYSFLGELYKDIKSFNGKCMLNNFTNQDIMEVVSQPRIMLP